MDAILIITQENGAVHTFAYDSRFAQEVESRSWCVKVDEWGVYARTNVGRKQLRMHRLIMEWSGTNPEGYLVDHKDGNTLNNRLSNLRLSDATGNSRNRKVAKGRHLKNVNPVAKSGRFRAYIGKAQKQIHIGVFDTEREAMIAYDLKAAEMYGEFARPNIVNPDAVEVVKVRAIMDNVKTRKGSSRYRGVSLARTGKWLVMIAHKTRKHYLGYFPTEREAALAYNAKATELLGDKAKLNVVTP